MLGIDVKNFTVDFIAKGRLPNEWMMVLVEEGDWSDIDGRLHRLQDRLYDCIDAVLDGQMAEKYPESTATDILIQVEFFNAPEDKVAPFVERFSKGVFSVSDYADALRCCRFAKSISIGANFNAPKKLGTI
jgi:hypothetical protein